MITCMVLSAGLSRRFGSPKALARINGDTVIGRIQKVLINSQVDEILFVLGAHAELIKPSLLNHTKVKSVYNKDYNLGQTSSFQTGLRTISEETQGVLLLPVDFAWVSMAAIDEIIGYFREHTPLVILPSFNGKLGHPPLFSSQLKEEFLKLDPEDGLNTVVRVHKDEIVILPLADPGILKTFNTKKEFNRIRRFPQ